MIEELYQDSPNQVFTAIEALSVVSADLSIIADEIAVDLSVRKRKNHNQEVFPILFNPDFFQRPGKKTPVLNFLLSKIPEPAESVSWEQLQDFKSDEDTMRACTGSNDALSGCGSNSGLQDKWV